MYTMLKLGGYMHKISDVTKIDYSYSLTIIITVDALCFSALLDVSCSTKGGRSISSAAGPQRQIPTQDQP